MSVKDSRIEFANALKHLIKRENLEAVSVGEIAAEAGLSRQLFYKYFTDKYDLAFWCYMQMISPVAKAYIDGRISFHEQNVTMLNIFRKISFKIPRFRIPFFSNISISVYPAGHLWLEEKTLTTWSCIIYIGYTLTVVII